MEPVIDVSWMNHGKDKIGKHNAKQNTSSPPSHDTINGLPIESATPGKLNGKTAPISPPPSPPPAATPPNARPIPPRQGLTRSGSIDEKKSPGPNGTPPTQRRGSWFSKISGSFSSSPGTAQQPNPATPSQSESDDVTPLPKISPNKNAVLPHATRQPGDGPYVPAPPRNGQPGFFQVFRRKSSFNGAVTPGKNNHGLVERRVLNVDKRRERPRLSELSQAKLRRVAFCVDVEIAPMPKYSDSESADNKTEEKTQKRKIAEKGEGEALKRPKAVEEEKETQGVVKATGEQLPKEPTQEGANLANGANGQPKDGITVSATEEPKPEKENTRKKEKKKKSESERKAKKEQKRKEALEKGAIPMEIHLDSDSSTEDAAVPQIPRPKYGPTTNPGRIYRRCCQLRETDILTKITSQLPKSTASNHDGFVEKLDLSGYFMSLPDLVTLGDFFAVVPVKEVILEDCGLTDEGVRVVLAGLLASKKQRARQRKSVTKPADLCNQGGVVERLVLRNNKLGVEGWKHICLFLHMCRSLKCLDLSSIAFPAPSEPVKTTPLSHHFHHHTAPVTQLDTSLLLSKALGERLAGSELELLNLGETGLTTTQLGAVIDGCLKSGISRLGLAHNDLDAQGIEHVARYLRGGKCQGLDLGGNDLRDHLQVIADAISEHDENLWALSLANSNIKPSSLCKLFPKLAQIKNCKFIDLSHNHELCESQPSAIGLLRRYLPKLDSLKRLHLADIAMTSEQAIAVAEILPEVSTLAHINLLENPELVRLADAKTEEAQEEACALYASLLAAARVSETLVKVDIDTPSAGSSEVVKALANQTLAYCLRNLRMAPDIRDSASGEQAPEKIKYPDVLRHIVGHEEDTLMLNDNDTDAAPDEDYVIGGTGVVKALTCCLNNLEQNGRRDSGEFVRDLETGTTVPGPRVPAGKAKNMSKHLLASARKIRVRLQPVLAEARAYSRQDMNNYNRLLFLDQTLQEIISRFEDEFPETRQEIPLMAPHYTAPAPPPRGGSFSSAEADPVFTDTEDFETELRSASRSRSNSILSHTSKQLAEEEGRALRVGHHFRRGFIQDHYNLLTGAESEIGNDPSHKKLIEHLLEDLGPDAEDIRKKIEEKGAIITFQEERNEILRRMRDKDPVQWDRFIEAQEKARANLHLGNKEEPPKPSTLADESAIAD